MSVYQFHMIRMGSILNWGDKVKMLSYLKLPILFLCIFLIIAGCATAGGAGDKGPRKTVIEGMSTEKVLEIMGKPSKVSEVGSEWIDVVWHYNPGFSFFKPTAHISFKDGKVVRISETWK